MTELTEEKEVVSFTSPPSAESSGVRMCMEDEEY